MFICWVFVLFLCLWVGLLLYLLGCFLMFFMFVCLFVCFLLYNLFVYLFGIFCMFNVEIPLDLQWFLHAVSWESTLKDKV